MIAVTAGEGVVAGCTAPGDNGARALSEGGRNMNKLVGLMAAAIVVLAVSLTSRPAAADFTVCSQYRETIYVVYGYHDGSDWLSDGWWVVPPGGCTVLLGGPLTNRYYYLYAEADDGGVWDGNYPFCVEWSNDFVIWGNVNCDVGFLEVDTGNAADWTHTLTP